MGERQTAAHGKQALRFAELIFLKPTDTDCPLIFTFSGLFHSFVHFELMDDRQSHEGALRPPNGEIRPWGRDNRRNA
jgi:hypothetical protein